jgi:hypothetical protein
LGDQVLASQERILQPWTIPLTGYFYTRKGDQGKASACSASSDGLLVYYLPDSPEISCLGDPKSLLENEETSIGLAMAILPSFALLGSRWRFPVFRRWLAS